MILSAESQLIFVFKEIRYTIKPVTKTSDTATNLDMVVPLGYLHNVTFFDK